METEIWKDIPWYEWYYMVSNLGRVKSLDRYVRYNENSLQISRWTILSHWISRWYCTVHLSKYKQVSYKVHRLVASAFLWLDLYSFTDRKTSLCVCHKNDIRNDNRVENLFLWTYRENNQDKAMKWRSLKWSLNPMFWKTGLMNPRSKTVYQYDFEMNFIKKWDSASVVSREIWINQSSISQCCLWKYKSAGWFKWSYIKL